MAAGLGLRVAVGTTGASLQRSIIDQSATGAGLFGSARSFVVPPGEPLASVRVKAPRRRDIVQSWGGKNFFVPLSVAVDDSVAAAGLTLSDRSICEDIGDPKEELDFRGAVQEPELSESQSQVPSSADSKPILQGEGGTPTLDENQRWTLVKKKLAGIISNAQKNCQGVYHIKQSLGVDLGDTRTGVAISLKGYAPRPLSVLQFKGDKLIENLLQIASKERADEFIVGLPISFDGRETPQSNKTRSFAGRLATQAAQRGWRVYLLDEYGSSKDGMDYMLDIGIKKKSRKEKLDSYAALVLLHSYFRREGAHVKLVIPKGLSSQERLCFGDESVIDDFNTEDDL